MSKFEEFKKAKAAYLEALDQIGEEEVVAEYRRHLEQHPDVYGVMWTQWTPSFNDGEPCRFMVTEPTQFTKKQLLDYLLDKDYEENVLEEQEEDDLFRSLSLRELEGYSRSTKNMLFMDEDILESVFGDGVTVVVTRTGVYTREYFD